MAQPKAEPNDFVQIIPKTHAYIISLGFGDFYQKSN